MKRKISNISFLIVLVFVFFMSTIPVIAAGAGGGIGGSATGGTVTTEETGSVTEETQVGHNGETQNSKTGTGGSSLDNDSSGNGDTLRDRTRLMEQDCSTLKEKISDLEDSCVELQSRLQTALEQQNEDEAQQLREQLRIMEQQQTAVSGQLRHLSGMRNLLMNLRERKGCRRLLFQKRRGIP